MQHDFAAMSTSPMLDQINALSRSERQAAVDDRNGKVSLRQRRANVRRHVVRAFGTMLEQRVAVGHQAREKSLEIARDFRVGILLNQQAR
jgi:hypothetical protein